MKNIYHIHTSGNYDWTDKDYYLCESMEEYNEKVAEYKANAEKYQNSENAKIYGAWRIQCGEEGKIHASEYYYAHEWQGKTFDAIGVCYEEHLERSNHYTYIIKPDTLGKITPCTDPGIGWMYGS